MMYNKHDNKPFPGGKKAGYKIKTPHKRLYAVDALGGYSINVANESDLVD